MTRAEGLFSPRSRDSVRRFRVIVNACASYLAVITVGSGAKAMEVLHPHMPRYACGYKPANGGHDICAIEHYLRHNNMTQTVRYTEMPPDRFKGSARTDDGYGRRISTPPEKPLSLPLENQ